MIAISRLYEFLIEKKAEITELNTVKLVVDESEIINDLSAHKESDNMILVGVIPAFDNSPTKNEDAIAQNNYLMFMILEKTNYAKFKSMDDRVSLWNRTQQVMGKFYESLIEAKTTGANGLCPEFHELDISSIRIDPVWMLAQCNGWMLTVTIEK